MTDEQNRQAQVLFADAVELPAEEREAFVRAKTGDAEVLSRVMELLADERLMGGFMDTLTVVKDPGALATTPGRAFAAGQLVAGRYRIARLIAFGGMGEVYEAHDLTLDLRVALKTILPAIARDQQVMSRFRQEVKLTRKIGNPHVCRIFDIGEHREDGAPSVTFLSMEYLAGETLAKRLARRGKFQPEDALPLIRQMAEALEATHASGVIHRDFKPGNVMLVKGDDGKERAIVTDFGLARKAAREQASTALSQSGQLLGTPDYMAPEQLTAGKATPAIDVYALGLVIYEMVTGKRPFERPHQRLMGVPAPAKRHVPDLPEPWVRVIGWCLEKNPERRPKSPIEAVHALEGNAVVAPLAESEVRAEGVARRWAIVAMFILVTLAALFLRIPGFERSAPANTDTKHVAVLPFRVSDEGLQVFADGLMEAITSRLSQYEGMNETLLVVPPSEVRSQKVESVSGVRSKFGANLAVEGNLYSEDDRLRLILTLSDAAAERQMDTIMVEGNRSKALALQDGAVTKLVNVLDVRVRPENAAELNEISPIEPAAYDFYVQGLGYLQRNDRLADIDNAIALFSRAIEHDDGFARAYAGLGDAYLSKYLRTSDARWIDEASDAARAALGRDGERAEPYITMGRVLNEKGSYQEAVSKFEQALQIEPRNGAAFEGLGLSYTRLNRPSDAEATYRAMASLRSGDWRAYHQLGLFYKRQGDLQSAIREYLKVISLAPDNAIAYSNLGSFYYLSGQFKRAKEMWVRSVQIVPSKAALSNLGKLQLDDGEFENAARSFEQAIELGNTDFRTWNTLAVAYRRSGREEDAARADRRSIALAEQILSRNPSDLAALTHLAFDYASMGESDRAKKLLDRAVELGGTGPDPDILVKISRIYVKLGVNKEALKYLRMAIERSAKREVLQRDSVVGNLIGLLAENGDDTATILVQ